MRVSFRSLESLTERIWQGKSMSRLASPGSGWFLPVIQVGNLSTSGLLPDIEEIEISDHPGEDAFVKVGYVLLGQATSNMTAVAIDDEHFERYVAGPNIAIFAPKDEVLPSYLAGMLNTETVRRQLRRRAGGGMTKQVSLEELRRFSIPLPSIEDQALLVEMFEAALETESLAKQAIQAQGHALEQAASQLWERAEEASA